MKRKMTIDKLLETPTVSLLAFSTGLAVMCQGIWSGNAMLASFGTAVFTAMWINIENKLEDAQ